MTVKESCLRILRVYIGVSVLPAGPRSTSPHPLEEAEACVALLPTTLGHLIHTWPTPVSRKTRNLENFILNQNFHFFLVINGTCHTVTK